MDSSRSFSAAPPPQASSSLGSTAPSSVSAGDILVSRDAITVSDPSITPAEQSFDNPRTMKTTMVDSPAFLGGFGSEDPSWSPNPYDMIALRQYQDAQTRLRAHEHRQRILVQAGIDLGTLEMSDDFPPRYEVPSRLREYNTSMDFLHGLQRNRAQSVEPATSVEPSALNSGSSSPSFHQAGSISRQGTSTSTTSSSNNTNTNNLTRNKSTSSKDHHHHSHTRQSRTSSDSTRRRSRAAGTDPDQPPTPYQCFDHGCAGRSFSCAENYRRHVREQSRQITFECPRCHTSFSRKGNRDLHLSNGRCKAPLVRSAEDG